LPFSPHKNGVSVAIRLQPGGRRDAVLGFADRVDGGKALKCAVTAPPEDGKANDALIKLLSKEWGLPKTALSVISGGTNRTKALLAAGGTKVLAEKLEAWAISTGLRSS
jgi:uncharacterized protein (TIGR00251 family)